MDVERGRGPVLDVLRLGGRGVLCHISHSVRVVLFLLRASDALTTPQLVYPVLHRLAHDADLDLSGLPAPDRGALRRRALVVAAPPCRHGVASRRRRLHHPGHRLHGQPDHVQRLHLPADDAEAAQGGSATGHVRERRAECLHHRRHSGLRRQPREDSAEGFHGRREVGGVCAEGRGELGWALAVGVCFLFLLSLSLSLSSPPPPPPNPASLPYQSN